MKKITILLLFFSVATPILGAVSTKVCEADGNTPFNGRDIMVGTKLTIMRTSPAPLDWIERGIFFIVVYVPVELGKQNFR